jgi:hypothetical protein
MAGEILEGGLRRMELVMPAVADLTPEIDIHQTSTSAGEGGQFMVECVDHDPNDGVLQVGFVIPVFDKSQRTDGTFSPSDFVYDPEQDHYTCPGGERLVQYRRNFTNRRSGVTKDGVRFYRARQSDCQRCDLKSRCCPNTPRGRIPRDLDEDARDVARALAGTPVFERSRHHRKTIERLFAHLKRILRLARLRLRGPSGARDEFLLAATAQNLRRFAKLRPMPTLAGGGA